MRKTSKKIMAVLVTALLSLSIGAVTASAGFESGSYASFTWGNDLCKIKNTQNTTRYMTAYFEAYEKNTGAFLGSDFGENTGAYGTEAIAYNPVVHSSMNNYKWYGTIYNGGYPFSGILESFQKP